MAIKKGHPMPFFALYDFRNSSTSDFGFAPIEVAAGSPFLKSINVGMDITLYLSASVSASSVFTLQNFISATSSDISSMIGESILQGPHHDAQKSTSTGLSDFNTSCSKFSCVKLITDITFTFFLYIWKTLCNYLSKSLPYIQYNLFYAYHAS
jgi:hypothetical protein